MIFVSVIKFVGCLKCKHYDSSIGCTRNVQDSDLVIEWLTVYCTLGEEIENEDEQSIRKRSVLCSLYD
jgi:hypothetical protein